MNGAGSSTAAAIALRCLDLTSLNDADDEAAITRLCQRAQGVHGAVAAVCVWPRFARLARSLLPPQIAGLAAAIVGMLAGTLLPQLITAPQPHHAPHHAPHPAPHPAPHRR